MFNPVRPWIRKSSDEAHDRLPTGGRVMKYRCRSTASISTTNVAASGANVSLLSAGTDFLPWQPSTWPPAPSAFQEDFQRVIERIVGETIIEEIGNVVDDICKSNGDLRHRGHVVAIAMLCAVDTLSSYAFDNLDAEMCQSCKRGDKVGPRYERFVETFFPDEYRALGESVYSLYRNAMVHSWNLFQVTIYPDGEVPRRNREGISFGLLNFFKALQSAASAFLKDLSRDANLQASTLKRYRSLKESAQP